MERVKLREAAKLNANHNEVNPGFGAGLGALVVPREPAMAHMPTAAR